MSLRTRKRSLTAKAVTREESRKKEKNQFPRSTVKKTKSSQKKIAKAHQTKAKNPQNKEKENRIKKYYSDLGAKAIQEQKKRQNRKQVNQATGQTEEASASSNSEINCISHDLICPIPTKPAEN